MQSRLLDTVTNVNIALGRHRSAFVAVFIAVMAVMAFVSPEVHAGLAGGASTCPGC